MYPRGFLCFREFSYSPEENNLCIQWPRGYLWSYLISITTPPPQVILHSLGSVSTCISQSLSWALELQLPAHVWVDYLSCLCCSPGLGSHHSCLFSKKEQYVSGLNREKNMNIASWSQNTNASHGEEHKRPAGKTALFTDVDEGGIHLSH